MKDNILPIIILVVLTLLVGGIILFDINQREIIEQETPTIPLIENNTLIGIVPPNYREPITYGTLLNCLSYYESKHNQEAIGQAGEIGCLQFMPSTWEYFNKKYGLNLDIDDSEDQHYLADKMIKENWNNLFQWTTAKFCVKI